MKKITILMCTVLFVFMVSIAYAGQKQMIDQTKLSAEEQIEYLDNSIKTYDGIIKDADELIGIYQNQKTLLIEERSKLSVYKEMLVSSRKANLKDRGDGQEAIIAGAVAVGHAATGNYVSAVAAASVAVNKALDGAIKQVEQKNAQIDSKLKDQRDWKASHQGKNK